MNEFLTAREAARELRICYSTMLTIIKEEKISVMKFGRTFRFRKEDLLAYGYANGSGQQVEKHYDRLR
jgi:excisionase family DNA binding protein